MNYRKSRAIVYRAKEGGSGKWIFAAIVFLLAMMITWSEVDGFNVPSVKQDSTKVANKAVQSSDPVTELQTMPPNEPDNPSPLPEPTTVLLLGAGVGAAYLMRRRKS